MTATPTELLASKTNSWTEYRSGSAAVDELLHVLAVVPSRRAAGNWVFHATNSSRPSGRVFGGQIMAQAAVAASLSVDPVAVVHSLHAYFVRAGRPNIPLELRVEPLRNGRSFRTRRVDVLQHDRLVCTVTASFHVAQEGIHHQDPMPNLPGPDGLAGSYVFADDRDELGAVELRPCPENLSTPASTEVAVWMRIAARLPDDPLLHRAILVYLSDLSVLRGAFRTHHLERGSTSSASLDHTIWLHEQARADEWLVYRSRSPWSGYGRAVGAATLFSASGELIANTGQEMIIRPRAR